MHHMKENLQFPLVHHKRQAPKTVGTQSIQCECGKVYIGQTGHSTKTRVNKCHHVTAITIKVSQLWLNTATAQAMVFWK
jgi:hypothetical protein